MGGSRVVRLHASLVLFLVFVNFCLTKKEKEKKRKLLPFAKVFSLANEVFFDFRESFLREIRPKNYYSESFCKKFRDFLILRKFLLAKVSAPKVYATQYVWVMEKYETFCVKIKCSCLQMFFKRGFLKNFTNFTEKHLCWSLFLLKSLA